MQSTELHCSLYTTQQVEKFCDAIYEIMVIVMVKKNDDDCDDFAVNACLLFHIP